MGTSVRGVLGGFDRFSVILQGAFARFGGVVVQWFPDAEECLVVAALDEGGQELELSDPSLLQVWSESLPFPVPAGAVRLLSAEVDLSAGVEFRVLRDVPVWHQVLHGAVDVANGVQDDTASVLLADGAWLVLSSIGAPSGGVLVDQEGQPTGVCDAADSRGQVMVWPALTERVGDDVAGRLRIVCAALALLVAARGGVVSLAERPAGL